MVPISSEIVPRDSRATPPFPSFRRRRGARSLATPGHTHVGGMAAILKRAPGLDAGGGGTSGDNSEAKRRRVAGASDDDDEGIGEEAGIVELDFAEFSTHDDSIGDLWDLIVSGAVEEGSGLPDVDAFDPAPSEAGGPFVPIAGAASAKGKGGGRGVDGRHSLDPHHRPPRTIPTALVELIEGGHHGGAEQEQEAADRAELLEDGGMGIAEGDAAGPVYRETFLAAQEAIRSSQDQRLRECISLASTGSDKAAQLLEEIALHLDSRAERVSRGSGGGALLSFDLDCSPWMGVQSLADLLKSLRDSRADREGHPAAPTVMRICRAIMKQVPLLEEDQLVSEGLKSLGLLVRYLYIMMAYRQGDQMRLVFRFIADLVLRHITSASLPVRLWGWEQASLLIDLGRRHRWYFKAYLVEGAGSSRCNGVYRVSAEDAKSATLRTARLRRSLVAPTYHRAESEVGCFVRMKQYEIKSQQAFWWFISEPDPVSPGDAGDVKYYCRKSRPTETFLPPRKSGWLKSDAGRGPPPTVTPIASEGYLCPPGQEYDSLEWELANWVVNNKVVEEIFGDRLHKDVVVHSGKLLQFLGGMEDKLTAGHVDLMWRSCIKESAVDLRAAVYKVLAVLVKTMSMELVVHLFGRLQGAVDGDAAWGGRSHVLGFLGCLVSDEEHAVIARDKAVRTATARLVWSLLKQPEVLRHESCKLVATLLASVSYRPSPVESQGELNVAKFVDRCITRWREQSLARGGASVPKSLEAVRHMLDNFELEQVQELAQLYYGFPQDPDAEGQVVKFIAESGSFSECYICSEPLLNNIGNSRFGMMSWSCRCTVTRKAHSACIFSKLCHGQPDCDMCHQPMSFAKASGSGAEVTIKVHSPGR